MVRDKTAQDSICFVDTIFGHVSLDANLGLVKYRSTDEATVTSLQGSCRWRDGADRGTIEYD